MSEQTVYRFHCSSCGSEFASAKNEDNDYTCPYCESHHTVNADSQEAQVEELSLKQLNALVMSLGRDQMRAVAKADMKTVSMIGPVMMKASKVLARYYQQSEQESAELDAKLQEQFRKIKENGVANSVVYRCSQCGAPIDYIPINSYEEIICPSCGGLVGFNPGDGSVEQTHGAMSQEEKVERMQKLGEEYRAAVEADDQAAMQRLTEELQELSMGYTVNFDYTSEVAQQAYQTVADKHGASLMRSAKSSEFMSEQIKINDHLDVIRKEMNKLEKKIKKLEADVDKGGNGQDQQNDLEELLAQLAIKEKQEAELEQQYEEYDWKREPDYKRMRVKRDSPKKISNLTKELKEYQKELSDPKEKPYRKQYIQAAIASISQQLEYAKKELKGADLWYEKYLQVLGPEPKKD